MRGEAQERVFFIRPPALPGTEFKSVSNSRRHWRGFLERYAFVAAREADAIIRYRGVDQILGDRTVAIREPGEAYHVRRVAKPSGFRVLFVEPEVMEDTARELGLPRQPRFPPVVIPDPQLFGLLSRLCDLIEEGEPDLEQQYLFTLLMMELARYVDRSCKPILLKNGKLAVATAKAYLREHCSEPVALGDLAMISGLGRFSLVHAFTREVGLSPHAYQVHVRVERARELLMQGVSPAVAAATTGFSDQSHLTRHFKRIMQLTPSHYARAAF